METLGGGKPAYTPRGAGKGALLVFYGGSVGNEVGDCAILLLALFN